MKLGYCRVSTGSQDTAMQEAALLREGCDRIFRETASGANRDRAELAKLLDHAREGDCIVVWKLDRLARSLRHLIEIAETLKARSIELISITERIDTSSPMGEAMFQMCGVMAQLERALIAERREAGLARALASGKRLGRKRADHPDKIGRLAKAKVLIADGMSPARAAREAGLARSTVYKYLQEGVTDGIINGRKKRTESSNGKAGKHEIRI